MLERLLAQITSKGAVSLAELAGELDTSPEMVALMLEDLERRGYLQAVQGCATGSCAGCSLPKGCQPVRLWTVGKRWKSSQADNG